MFRGVDEVLVSLAIRAPVQLQQLSLSVFRPAIVLEHVDARHLTRLDVSCASAAGSALLPAALSRLVGLQDLRLSVWSDNARHEGLAGAVAPLTALTRLALQGQGVPASVLQQLPTGLVSLHLSGPGVTGGDLGLAPFTPNLVGLQQLQHLTVYNAAGDLSAMTTLNARLNLKLCLAYSHLMAGTTAVAAHVPVWGRLATLRSLTLVVPNDCINARMASGIAAATTLTSLALECDCVASEVNMETMLAPLSQLQYLKLRSSRTAGTQPGIGVESFGNLMSHLTWLELLYIQVLPLARTQVTTSTCLEHLRVDCIGIGDGELVVMGHYMANLRVLCMARVAAAMVEAALMRGGFPKLRELVLLDSDMHYMSAVQQAEAMHDILAARPGLKLTLSGVSE